MNFLRRLTPRPKCVMCGDLAAVGTNRCQRHRTQPPSPNQPPSSPLNSYCVVCGVQIPPGTDKCPQHREPVQQPTSPARPRSASPSRPRSLDTPAERVRISFGNAVLLGAGFTLGVFLMTVLLIVCSIFFLPVIVDVIAEAIREAMVNGP